MCPHAQIRDYKTIRCVLAHELALVRQGLQALIARESSKRLGELGGTEPQLTAIRRKRARHGAR